MKVKKNIVLLLMATLAVACSKDVTGEENTTTPLNDADIADTYAPVSFSVSGQQMFDLTRSLTSVDEFDANEEIKVWVKPYGAANYIDYDYTTKTNGSTKVDLTPPATPPYFPANEPSTVEAYAYYPATAATTFSVMDDQTTTASYKASDLMFAKNRTITKGAGKEELEMKHQMAQFKITASVQAGSGLNIIGVTVKAKKSVTFTPEADKPTETVGDLGFITALNEAGTGYILLPPQEVEGVTINVITGEGTDAETARYVLHSNSSLDSIKAGCTYGIELKVTANQIGTTSVLNDWNHLGTVTITPSGNLVVVPQNVDNLKYTGSPHEPAVLIYKNGNPVADQSKYSLQYVSNVNAGQAFVIVTGDPNDNELKGDIGIATFMINKADGEISYTENAVAKTYGDDPFTHPLTKTTDSDGTVTYNSSNQTVATVNSVTGQVTILKAGTTTITATVADGANWHYATPTASYTLTVNKAAGSISFANTTPSVTWSATGPNTYSQTATIVGDGTVSYAIGDVNNCGATIDGHTITFTESGSVKVTATVTDGECYTYATKTVNYLLTVNKATGYVVLQADNGSVRAGQSATITVSSSHSNANGALEAAATSGSTNRVPTITGPTNNQFTVFTNGTTGTTVTITVTCKEDVHYNAASATYTLMILPTYDVRLLPLYYVAEYNVQNASGTTFATTPSGGNLILYDVTMQNFAAQTTRYSNYRTAGKGPNNQWHLPVAGEWVGIIPSLSTTPGVYDNLFDFVSSSNRTSYRTNFVTSIWGYNSATKSGISESSYFVYCADNELHAIRFLGTDYCSAWKWVWANSTMTIYATLIGNVTNTQAAAADWYTSNFSHVTFGNDAEVGAVKREFYATGEISTDNSTPRNVGIASWYYTASNGITSDKAYLAKVSANSAFVYTDGLKWGFTVRLFRDN